MSNTYNNLQTQTSNALHNAIIKAGGKDRPLMLAPGDYSKPSHEGYRNTIELPAGNNVVPLRSGTIWLVQNGCSFYGLRSEDPNQHLKDFLKLVDSLDPNGSISTWEDLTTRFLAQFFPPGRTAKLRNDILMFQQHHGESRLPSYRFNVSADHRVDLSPAIYSYERHPASIHSSTLEILLPRFPLSFNRFQSHRKGPDDMIGKINLLWKTVFEKLNDASPPKNAGNFMAPKALQQSAITRRRNSERKESKAYQDYSPQNISPASIKELNKNPSSLKRVHFVNSIVILSTDSDTKEEHDSSTNAYDLNLDGMVKGKEEVKEKGKQEDEMETNMEVEEVIEEEESEFETDEEVKEIFEEEEEDEDDENFNSFPTMKELSHHEWLLKNPRPLWVKAKECDLMILEDTTSIIDHHLGEMVFGRPFIEETSLVYSKEEGTVMFEQNDEKITFKFPHTMEIFRQTKLMGLSTDSIPPFAHEENFSHGRTHYYQSLTIKDEYKQDGGDRRGIRHLMRLEKEMMDNKGEDT
ncbi:MAK10-like protein [Tanacetum coccineum]